MNPTLIVGLHDVLNVRLQATQNLLSDSLKPRFRHRPDLEPGVSTKMSYVLMHACTAWGHTLTISVCRRPGRLPRKSKTPLDILLARWATTSLMSTTISSTLLPRLPMTWT